MLPVGKCNDLSAKFVKPRCLTRNEHAPFFDMDRLSLRPENLVPYGLFRKHAPANSFRQRSVKVAKSCSLDHNDIWRILIVELFG